MILAQEYVPEFPIDQLTEHPDNPRRGNVEVIEESIESNGFFGAVLVQASTKRIIVGNHRTRVAASLGQTTVPAFLLDVDDEAATKIMLAENRSNDLAGYDERGLADLLSSIPDLVGTGFKDYDLEILLAKLNAEEPEVPEPVPVGPAPRRVEMGDIWRVGSCLLMCGDCRQPDVLDRLLGEPVNLAFTSPPYADRRRYDTDSEFRPIHPDHYVEWFEPVQRNIGDHLAADGSWIVNIRAAARDDLDMETYVLDLVLAHVRNWGWHWGAEFCWERVGVPGRFTRRFKSAFEPIYQFTKGDWKTRPDQVRHYSTDVPRAIGGRGDWTERQGDGVALFKPNDIGAGLAYPSNRLPPFGGVGGEHVALGHPAAFPPGLARFFVLAFTDRGDSVLDPFVGSGSTLMAAAAEGREGYGVEISPAYCDTALVRLETATDESAELVERAAIVV